jgi:RHS repeat-associated protein
VRTCFEGPFGEVIRATGPMAKANPFRFSTKYQDDESDLLYYGYRYYSASTGRWLSRDPIGEEGGHNLLVFVRNNPVELFDKLGQQFCGYGCMPKDCDGVPDGPTPEWSWSEGINAVANALTILDLALGGPTGEGIVPAAIIKWVCKPKCPSPQQIKCAVQKIQNTLKHHVKPGPKGDVAGTVGDILGRPIPKPGGGTFDHIKEMQDTLRGLRKQMETLKDCTDPAAQQAFREAEAAVQQIEAAIKGAGI